jgi:hypothetical protein
MVVNIAPNWVKVRINVLLDCVHRPRFHKTWISLRFGNWLYPCPQVYKIRGERLKDIKVKNGIKPTRLGPLEGANLNHWTYIS